MKKMIKSALDKIGYTVFNKEAVTPIDLRGEVMNPLLAKYSARKYSFLINADFKNCIVLYRFSCEKNGNNPLILAVTDYLRHSNVSYSGSELEHYYNTFKPANVAEMFNLEGELHKNLIQLPANLFVYPWEDRRMKNAGKFRERLVKTETRRRGNELPMRHGDGITGPASKQRGELETRALIDLTKSIKANNYRRGNGLNEDIIASILVDDKEYKYLIKDGTHRLVVLSALGYETAPIRVVPSSIPAFIYRNEAEFWPNVRSGLYTKSQALKIFDTIFKGEGLTGSEK